MAAALLFGLASCGGGGTPAAVSPSTRPILTSTLRTVNNGDFIQYSISGTVSSGGVTSSLTGTASSVFSSNASPLDPSGMQQSTSTVSMTGTLTNGAPFSSNSTAYVSQDAIGTLYVHGKSAGGWITMPASGFITSLSSPIIAPASWTNNYTLQNGDTTSDTITVIGRSTVSTGLGSFETFQVQTTGTTTIAAGGSYQYTQNAYIVPGIGTVKMAIAQTVTDNLGVVSTLSINLNASTTNIAY